MRTFVACLTLAAMRVSADTIQDFGASVYCPLGTGSLVVVTGTNNPENNYLVGRAGTVIAHNAPAGEMPGYQIMVPNSSDKDYLLFKCTDIEAQKPLTRGDDDTQPPCNANTNVGCPPWYICENLLGSTNGDTACVFNPPPPPATTQCNANTNQGCPRGFTCRNMLGNSNGATTCVKDPPAKQCYSNKGGMCVLLQERPSYNCYASQGECQNTIDTLPSAANTGGLLGGNGHGLPPKKDATSAHDKTADDSSSFFEGNSAGLPPLIGGSSLLGAPNERSLRGQA